MQMIRTMKFRLDRVTTLLLVAFFVLLTCGLMLSAYVKFGQMARDNARLIFGQLVQGNADRFAASMLSVRRTLDVQSALGYPKAVAPGDREQLAIEQRFVTELRERPDLYAYYVGLQNGDFFQAIAVRGNARLIKSLAAPQWTQSAIRLIRDVPADAVANKAAHAGSARASGRSTGK